MTTISPRAKKAVVASALGLALLTGAGGTFANWYDNQAVGAGQVTAGNLSLTVATPVWKDQTGATIDPATFRMVPGDTLTYTATVTPTLVGTNIKANLQVDKSALTGTLAQYATVTTTTGAGTSQLLTQANSGTPVPVTVTISLPFTTGDPNGTDAENTTLDLSTVKLSLVQVQ